MKAVTYLKQFLSLKSLCLIIGGSLVYSIGFNMFILPCNLYNGGFLGIAQLLGYFMRNVMGLSFVTDNYIGIIYFLLNIPLMLLAIRKFGKDFLVKSAVCITSYSVLLSLVPVAEHNYLPDTITACLAGGILCGLGCGMTLMSKGSGGGEGILGLLLMQMAVYNRQTLPLNTKFVSKGNVETNYFQIIAELIAMFAPVMFISILKSLCSETVTFIILLLAGVLLINVFPMLIWVGIVLFAMTTLFSFVTLPCEINASQRAVAWLSNTGVVTDAERPMAVDEGVWLQVCSFYTS